MKRFYFLCRKTQNRPKYKVMCDELFKHQVVVTVTSNENKSRVQKYLYISSNNTCLMLPWRHKEKVSCPYLKYFLNPSSDLHGMNSNLVRNLNHLKSLYYSLQFPLTVTCLVLSLSILGMCLLAHLNLDFPDTSALLQDVTKSFSRSIGRRMKKKKKYWDRRAATSYI
jgi:hypothetical protein